MTEVVTAAQTQEIAAQDESNQELTDLGRDPKLKPKHPGGKFQPGHPKFGGLTKGTKTTKTKLARDIAAELRADPVRFMLELLVRDSVKIAQTDPKTGACILDSAGLPVKVWVAIPLDIRLDAAKSVAKYIHPTLAAVQVTGANGGPLQTVQYDMAKLMQNPEMLAAAQTLSLNMSSEVIDATPEVIEDSPDSSTE